MVRASILRQILWDRIDIAYYFVKTKQPITLYSCLYS